MTIRRYHFIIFICLFFIIYPLTKVYESKISFSSADFYLKSRNYRQVALTFDDGPHKDFTKAIVDILNKYNVKATFFLVGKQVEKYPELVKYICQNSDSKIANHTYSHKNLTLLSPLQIESELLATQELLYNISTSSDKVINYFRPPGGHFCTKVVSVAERLGYKIVLWSIFTNDHQRNVTKRDILQKIRSSTNGNEEIVLLHSGSNVTLECLPEIIEFFKNNGYKFVTVDEILEDETDNGVGLWQ
ncbi:MAG: polysaccharide deacetylase family protein [Endomicrobia bacterium]|nr:polysaccharide deacetylase family protein [Endomicrobiia bacterium]MCX7940453.1 polysaccharide deacetylase family protein [Endomicrobiia bacterium]MDW8055722.1 polysaccharide deacetylase family protein [Elusimicrobiota bacterium]